MRLFTKVFGGSAVALLIGITALIGGGTPSVAGASAPEVPYTQDGAWVCRPGMANDPCERPIDTTSTYGPWPFITKTDISEPRAAQNQRPVDCFYIYPTLTDHRTRAEYASDPAVQTTAQWQVGQFSSICRIFAPAYRQTTAPELGTGNSIATAYGDVLEAWRSYLANDNHGRGVIIIGHSQGSLMLRELIHNEIDPNPTVRSHFVGAFLLGGNVMVKPGQTTGGDFTNIPTCTTKGQFGCVVAYSTYDTDPGFELFGNASTDGLNGSPFGGTYFDDLHKGANYQVACTDPGPLSGMTGTFGITVPEDNVWSLQSIGLSWLEGVNPPPVDTTWVRAYDYRGSCRTINGANVFRYDPATWWSPRPTALPMMGTHEVDLNLGVQRLVRIAELETSGWLSAQS